MRGLRKENMGSVYLITLEVGNGVWIFYTAQKWDSALG